MKTLMIATTALVTAAAPALAGNPTPATADPVIVEPAPIVPVGYDWTGAYAGAQIGYGSINASGGATDEGDGVIGGLTFGYDYDFGQFVIGAGIDYDFADIEFDGSGDTLDNVGRIKVRGGFDAGNALIYATGGAAFADATIGGTDFSDNGWFAGAGVEYRVNDNIGVGGEILYHQFDDFDGTGVDVDATTFQARVTYRF